MGTDLKFEKEKVKRENKRLNAALKPDETFCVACGRVIKKTEPDKLCSWCRGNK